MQNINKILKKYYLQIAAIVSLTINFFELLGILVADADGFHSATESSAIRNLLSSIKSYASINTLSPFYDYD